MIGVKCFLKMALAALLSLSTACLLYPSLARAANEPALFVDSAAGEAGQIVSTSVTIRGLDRLSGVTGISGGQFELVYNPASAVVENVIQGRAIGSSFIFLHNRNFAPDKIRVAWASESGLISQDGTLCTITFKLSATGALTPSIQNLILYDQDMQLLEVVPEGEENIAFLLFSSETEQPSPEDFSGEVEEDDAVEDEKEAVEQPPQEADEKARSAAVFSKPIMLLIPVVLLLAGGLTILLLHRRFKRGKTRTRRG